VTSGLTSQFTTQTSSSTRGVLLLSEAAPLAAQCAFRARSLHDKNAGSIPASILGVTNPFFLKTFDVNGALLAERCLLVELTILAQQFPHTVVLAAQKPHITGLLPEAPRTPSPTRPLRGVSTPDESLGRSSRSGSVESKEEGMSRRPHAKRFAFRLTPKIKPKKAAAEDSKGQVSACGLNASSEPVRQVRLKSMLTTSLEPLLYPDETLIKRLILPPQSGPVEPPRAATPAGRARGAPETRYACPNSSASHISVTWAVCAAVCAAQHRVSRAPPLRCARRWRCDQCAGESHSVRTFDTLDTDSGWRLAAASRECA
jgi:hypothetical protein